MKTFPIRPLLLLSLVTMIGCGGDPVAKQEVAQDSPSATQPEEAKANASAAAEKKPEPRQFFVTGVVEKLQLGEGKVVIQHEEIPDFMVAMTMPFNVADTNEFSGVSTNDQVHFRLVVEAERSWVDRVTKVGSVTAMEKPRREFRRVRDVEPLAVGDVLPNYPLTNQVGRLFQTDDYRGQAMAFTFVFTRCPMPDFCPLMSRNFQKVYEEMRKNAAVTNWQLLTISFDVEADSPRVLNGYAKIYGADTNRWSFATGALIEIDDITERFGLYFSREEGVLNFNHNLRSVIVDPNGRIHKIYVGNTWSPAEFAKDFAAAAVIKPDPARQSR